MCVGRQSGFSVCFNMHQIFGMQKLIKVQLLGEVMAIHHREELARSGLIVLQPVIALSCWDVFSDIERP